MFVHLHNSEISIPHILAEAELGVDIISIGPAADIGDRHRPAEPAGMDQVESVEAARHWVCGTGSALPGPAAPGRSPG